MSDAANKTATLLAALWERNRPVVEERLATLDRAAEALGVDALDAPLRGEAICSSHKLAGSLGMYGYDEGTRVAREIEVMLAGASPCGVRMRALVAELRNAVFPAS
ncbi:MAG TPA: Hpt domain-containing protein [Acidobacteriaceae bacterium]|nr:Hpt domain-containing protein [Acidobacteriaceae bacterium]